MTGHIHAELMKQYAKDAAIHEKPYDLWEHKYRDKEWCWCGRRPLWDEETQYRRKPRTININGFEVPEPMRNKPKKDTDYYVVFISEDVIVESDCWQDYECENRWLKRGLCHATKEAAEIHAKALLSFTLKNGE